MPRTTYEEAKVCLSCREPGEEGGTIMIRPDRFSPSVEVVQIFCRNSRCVEHNKVAVLIQRNPDGSIPEPTMDPITKYKPLEGDLEHRRQQIIQSAEEELRRGETYLPGRGRYG